MSSFPIKVLHVIPSVSPVYGGPSYAIRRMTASLAKMGLDVDVATTNADGKKELEVPQLKPQIKGGARYFYFPRQFPKRWTFSFPLTRWLCEHAKDYDLLHIHALFSYPTLPACVSARRAGTPYILRPLGTLGKQSLAHKAGQKFLYYHLLERCNLRHAAAIHATSPIEAKSLEQLGFGSKTHVIPLGVDPGSVSLRSNTSGSRVRLLFLSRLHPMKALPLLFQSLVLLRREGFYPMLTVGGDGDPSYELTLKRNVEALELTSQVEFTGFIQEEEKIHAFAEADIFVQPSYQESFGIAAAEALAAGVPVVVSDQVGIAPAIQEYGAGVVVGRSPDSVKEGLKKLIRDPELRSKMGEEGRRLVREKFSWDKIAEQLIELYEGTLAGKV